MGLFDFFKKSKKEDALAKDINKVLFPGGKAEKDALFSELKPLLKNRYNDSAARGTMAYVTSMITFAQDKSADRVVYNGVLRRPHNTMTEEDAMTVYRFVVRNQYKKIFPSDNEEGFKAFYSALGNNEDGATTDIIPGAYVEYGLCATNPIPVKGTLAIGVYLKSLGLLSGESFTWYRVGSTGSENIDKPIDIYSITSESGGHLCDLYISLYQNTISKKAPKGFYIKQTKS